ncbi:MFS transporter [Beijerinckia indica]|uniref:Major facilitator superfamily MFS_1 n=1 Tax=Beijerinckia indica subsp. indica (strain ATCC 9039 / DSM 1715 / NCIMB 8712) TaxID=395963 RepID=B2IG08_BEII9|nr:MFS transporter [Beijerinckia indica]ACB95747.1 major facilitator superfamily MFS_1 [Beijerinckia indica subsp. indica ATCC 9039]
MVEVTRDYHFSPAADPYDRADVRRRTKAILIGSVGNLIEWYDVYAYSAFALYFGGAFFPSANLVAQQLAAASLFAAAFLMRPIGSLLFGYLADRYGRRMALTFSILLMCFGSLLIAVAPTYSTIGIGAPILLAFARILQGLSQGGEYGTSATYLAEVSHPARRGFYSGIWYTTLIGGQLAAIIVLLILQKLVLTPEQLYAFGWRIPFFIGAALALYCFFMRRDLHETDLFKKSQALAEKVGTWTTLRRNWKTILYVIGFTAGGTSAFYTYTTYMQKFVKLSVGLTEDETTLIIFGSSTLAVALQPLYGALSDKIGRKPMLLAFGIMGTLFTYPLLTTLQTTKSPLVAFLLICAGWGIITPYTSTAVIVKAELFPTSIRAIGVGFPYAIAAAVFGGTIDSVALSFKNQGHEEWFFLYATACIFMSLIFYCFLPDLKKKSRMDEAV